MESKERWIKLCERAAKEKDPKKLRELVTEIYRLLNEKQERLNKRDADNTPKS